jgi:hypothetical protein
MVLSKITLNVMASVLLMPQYDFLFKITFAFLGYSIYAEVQLIVKP